MRMFTPLFLLVFASSTIAETKAYRVKGNYREVPLAIGSVAENSLRINFNEIERIAKRSLKDNGLSSVNALSLKGYALFLEVVVSDHASSGVFGYISLMLLKDGFIYTDGLRSDYLPQSLITAVKKRSFAYEKKREFLHGLDDFIDDFIQTYLEANMD